MTAENKRRYLFLAGILIATASAVLLWLRADQPITTAKHVYQAKSLAGWFGGEYVDVFKVPAAGVVCGGYRGKDVAGKFKEPSTFIVWFQTRDWFSWRDPVLLRPTATEPAFIFTSGDAAEDQRRWDEGRAKLASERAQNDYYKFVDACQRALEARPAR